MTVEPARGNEPGPDDEPAPEAAKDANSPSRLKARVRIRWVGGEAGRALAVAQGRALRAALEVLGEVEVGQASEE